LRSAIARGNPSALECTRPQVALAPGERGEGFADLVDHHRDIDRVDVEPELIRIRPGERQHVVDQRAQSAGLSSHHRQVPARFLIHVAARLEQRFHVRADARDRRSELVRGVDDELTATLVGPVRAHLLHLCLSLG
jgi:hypothetical protein